MRWSEDAGLRHLCRLLTVAPVPPISIRTTVIAVAELAPELAQWNRALMVRPLTVPIDGDRHLSVPQTKGET